MSDDKKLEDFMRSEIERTRKGIGTTYIFGGIVAILIALYMTFILNMLKEATNGQFLAIAVRQQIEAAAPEMISSGEEALAAEAAVLANNLSNRFLEIIPELAQTGKESIDATYSEVIPYVADEVSAIVRDYIRFNEAEIREFADSHSIEQFAREFTRQVMDEFATQMDKRMKETTGGEGLAYFNDNLLVSLQAMDGTLEELLETPADQLTRRERLQRRILARLVTTVTEQMPDPQ